MFDKIKLPYKYDALEPYIDALTVEIHYTKHLQKYVDTLNSVLEGYENIIKGKSLEQILSHISILPKKIRQDVINQGGGVLNHNIYFFILSPNPKKYPEGDLLNSINKCFGNVENLKKELSDAAISQFGSGYGVLVKDKKGKLFVKKVCNQNTTLPDGLKPILNIDIWEHAYYLKYKNERAKYVNNIWNVIDWSKVEALYEGCKIQ